MPRTDSLDPLSHHNLKGIDLRKSADQNTALDAVNVHLGSRGLFVNRMMPNLYKDRSDKHLFACDARNLSGVDYDYDVSFDGASPSVSRSDTSVPEDYKEDFVYRLIGTGFSTVNGLLYIKSGKIKIGNTDFVYSYNKEDVDGSGTKSDTFLLSIKPASGSKIVLFSPFGASTFSIS